MGLLNTYSVKLEVWVYVEAGSELEAMKSAKEIADAPGVARVDAVRATKETDYA